MSDFTIQLIGFIGVAFFIISIIVSIARFGWKSMGENEGFE